MKRIEIESFLEFKSLSNLQSSPSETAAAFALTSINQDDNGYETNLWTFDGQTTKQLTSSNKDFLYLWENDETILFSSSRDKNNENYPVTNFYQISLNGGEATLAFSLNLAVSQIKKVKDGCYLVVAKSPLSQPEYYKMDKATLEKIAKEKKDNDYYQIIKEVPWWLNGVGFTHETRSRLFLYQNDTLSPLTSFDFNVDTFTLSNDRQAVYVLGVSYQKTTAPLYNHCLQINLENNETISLIDSADWSMSSVNQINDQLIVLSRENAREMVNQNAQFRRLDISQKTLLPIDNQEVYFGNSIGSDVRMGGSKPLIQRQEQLFYNTTVIDHSELSVFDGQKASILYSVEGSIDGFTFVNDQLVIIAMYQNQLQELYVLKDDQLQAVSQFNSLEAFSVATIEKFNYTTNGTDNIGYVVLPPEYDSSKTYPAILDIHGGPLTAYGSVYYHEMQVWANLGYVVFFTNPHGSSGRGDDFGDIYGKYGQIDYEDIMNFTDEVLQRYPSIDKERLGVTGGSYGGFMTNWIIGHTNRFKVAATQRSISNWLSFYGVSDIGYFFAEDQIRGSLFNEAGQKKLWDHSPLKFVSQMETPTLIIHSKCDYRCPVDQGYQLFTALAHKGVETKMVVFEEENHDLSRSGKPKARIKRLNEITEWMNKYLNN